MSLNGATMNAQSPGEGLHGRKKTLLQPRDQQRCAGLLPFRLTAQSLFSQLTILVKQHGEPELRRLWRKPADVDLPDDPLREPTLDGADPP